MNRQFLGVLIIIAAALTGSGIAGAPAGAQAPTLTDVLARAAKAAAAFADPSRVIFCEESYKPVRYKDTLVAGDGVMVNRRMLEAESWTAEMAVAPTPDLEAVGFPWWEFRDTRTVSGKPQPSEAPPGLDALLAEPAESLTVRFDGMKGRPETAGPGPYARAVMMPRVAALYLQPANQARFEFKDSTRYSDETVRKLTFKAKEKPTLLESPVGLLIMPTSGTIWIDQTTGTVRKALLRVEQFDKRRRSDWMLITYGVEGATGLWLPVSMEHQTENTSPYEKIEGKAEYTNCRTVPRTPR